MSFWFVSVVRCGRSMKLVLNHKLTEEFITSKYLEYNTNVKQLKDFNALRYRKLSKHLPRHPTCPLLILLDVIIIIISGQVCKLLISSICRLQASCTRHKKCYQNTDNEFVWWLYSIWRIGRMKGPRADDAGNNERSHCCYIILIVVIAITQDYREQLGYGSLARRFTV
jgi:hypothetical protein